MDTTGPVSTGELLVVLTWMLVAIVVVWAIGMIVIKKGFEPWLIRTLSRLGNRESGGRSKSEPPRTRGSRSHSVGTGS